VFWGLSNLVKPFSPKAAQGLMFWTLFVFVSISMTYLHRLRWYLRGLEEHPRQPKGQIITAQLVDMVAPPAVPGVLSLLVHPHSAPISRCDMV
jgi:hypothetical protein